MLDNSELIAKFCPQTADGDTFIYTEMLDRSARKGNNANRLVKTFYHRSEEEFREQWPTIKALCDLAQVRACTRLAPRSYRKVGAEFTRMVVDASLTDNFAGMKSLYNRACGIVSPNEKLWLFDVDVINGDTLDYEVRLKSIDQRGAFINEPRFGTGNAWVHIATIPSKKGLHYITRPFDMREHQMPPDVSLHKDNPTNLYIPEGAA